MKLKLNPTDLLKFQHGNHMYETHLEWESRSNQQTVKLKRKTVLTSMIITDNDYVPGKYL